MGRPSNTRERRAQIVAGLLRVMPERGFEKATVADIAAAAGLSPGLVHYHFATKHEILLALVESLGGSLRARYEECLCAAAPPRARLHALLDAHVALGPGADAAAVACWVAIGGEAVRHADVRAIYRGVVDELARTLSELVTAALAAEGRSTARARAIAAGLLAAIEGAFHLASAAPGVMPAGFAAPVLRRMADGLLAAEPKGAPRRRRDSRRVPRARRSARCA